MRRVSLFLLLATLLLAETGLGVASLERRNRALNHTDRARVALAEAIGIVTLAVDFECTAVRFPTEGLGACLGDVAGGYCAHNACDLVCQPTAERPVALTVIRPGS